MDTERFHKEFLQFVPAAQAEFVVDALPRTHFNVYATEQVIDIIGRIPIAFDLLSRTFPDVAAVPEFVLPIPYFLDLWMSEDRRYGKSGYLLTLHPIYKTDTMSRLYSETEERLPGFGDLTNNFFPYIVVFPHDAMDKEYKKSDVYDVLFQTLRQAILSRKMICN